MSTGWGWLTFHTTAYLRSSVVMFQSLPFSSCLCLFCFFFLLSCLFPHEHSRPHSTPPFQSASVRSVRMRRVSAPLIFDSPSLSLFLSYPLYSSVWDRCLCSAIRRFDVLCSYTELDFRHFCSTESQPRIFFHFSRSHVVETSDSKWHSFLNKEQIFRLYLINSDIPVVVRSCEGLSPNRG